MRVRVQGMTNRMMARMLIARSCVPVQQLGVLATRGFLHTLSAHAGELPLQGLGALSRELGGGFVRRSLRATWSEREGGESE